MPDKPIPKPERLEEFFSVDFDIEEASGRFVAECCVQPFSLTGKTAVYHKYRGILTDEWQEYLAERLGMTRGFVIPATRGTFFGSPDPDRGVTRCMLMSPREGQAWVYLRRTPITPPISEWYDDGLLASAMINDVIRTTIVNGYNLIICGGSGAGKTRFMIAYVIPNICSANKKMLYVETISEFAPYLSKQYGQQAPHRFLTLLGEGVGDVGKAGMKMKMALSMARTMGFDVVVFQEVRAGEEEEWISPETLRSLVFCGRPFVVTMHPTMGSPVLTAQYYDRELMRVPNNTIVIELGPRTVNMVHIGASGGVSLFLECRPREDDRRKAYFKTYPTSAQEQELREILERMSDKE